MAGKSYSSSSNSFQGGDDEGDFYCYCGIPSPRRTSWTHMNPGRRFHGCGRFREGSKCKYFKWVDKPFSARAREVILELLERQHQPPFPCMDQVEHVEELEAEVKALTSSTNSLKRDVSTMRVERKIYRAVIILFLCYLAYFKITYNVSVEKKMLSLP